MIFPTSTIAKTTHVDFLIPAATLRNQTESEFGAPATILIHSKIRSRVFTAKEASAFSVSCSIVIAPHLAERDILLPGGKSPAAHENGNA
jgi:hypothetical protein